MFVIGQNIFPYLSAPALCFLRAAADSEFTLSHHPVLTMSFLCESAAKRPRVDNTNVDVSNVASMADPSPCTPDEQKLWYTVVALGSSFDPFSEQVHVRVFLRMILLHVMCVLGGVAYRCGCSFSVAV